jgi:hypothetical protein
VNFSREEEPLELKIMRFAHNTTFEQAFVSGARGFNRPTNVKFGPDGCAWVVDYGAVRDFGQSDPDAKFIVPGDGPLVQIPHTGVIWRICPQRQLPQEWLKSERHRRSVGRGGAIKRPSIQPVRSGTPAPLRKFFLSRARRRRTP